MEAMKTIAEIRRDNLMILIGEQGSMAALNEKIGLVRTDATLSQIKNQSPDSKTGVPKAMGDAFARHQHRQQAVFFRLWKIFRVSLLTGA